MRLKNARFRKEFKLTVIVEEHFKDGAVIKSYPPSCSAWRNNRPLFLAYPDCLDCKGRGMHVISRPSSRGGSYYTYCATCLKRFNDHPARKLQQELYALADKIINDTWAKICKERFPPEAKFDDLSDKDILFLYALSSALNSIRLSLYDAAKVVSEELKIQ